MVLANYQRLSGERPDEYAARMIVETNSAWTLEVVDDGKSGDGLVDYAMRDSGRLVGVLEVGRNTDANSRANLAAWVRWAGAPRVLAGLKKSWLLGCDSQVARFKRIFELVLPILVALEAAGVDRAGRSSVDSWQPNSLAGRLLAIGVVSADVLPGQNPPGFVGTTLSSSAMAPVGPQPVS